MIRKAKRWPAQLGELLAFVAWSVLLIVPVGADLRDRAVGGGDARHWLWQGWRLAELVKGGDLPTRIPDVLWPYGMNLLVADGALPSAVGLMWNLVFPPTLAFNLAVISALVANAVAARYLASLFTTRRVVTILCGLAFAAAPALSLRLEGHYNLLFAFPAPLLVALAVRVVRGETAVPPLALGLLLALAYVSSGYYFFFGATTVGIAVVVADGSWRARGASVLRLATAALIAVVVLLPFLVPKLVLERKERAAGARAISSGAESFSADVASVFVPPPGQLVEIESVVETHGELGPNALELTTTPGILPLLGIAGVIVLRSNVRRSLLAAALWLWMLSLGPTAHVFGRSPLAGASWLPMAVLLELPGMAGVRAPNRASFTFAAVAVACMAMALGWLMERLRPGARAFVVVVCLAVLIAGVRVPIGWSEDQSGPEVIAALERIRQTSSPTDAFLHLPNDCLPHALQIDLQIVHRRPVVGCHGFDAATPWKTGLPSYFESMGWATMRCNPGAIGSRPVALPSDFDATPTPRGLDALERELDVRYVIFDRAHECPGRAEAILAVLAASARTLGDDGRLVVFDLAG